MRCADKIGMVSVPFEGLLLTISRGGTNLSGGGSYLDLLLLGLKMIREVFGVGLKCREVAELDGLCIDLVPVDVAGVHVSHVLAGLIEVEAAVANVGSTKVAGNSLSDCRIVCLHDVEADKLVHLEAAAGEQEAEKTVGHSK